MKLTWKEPEIPMEDKNKDWVHELLRIIREQREAIGYLKDRIAVLEGRKAKPKIEPSRLGKEVQPRDGGKRPGSAKRKKTQDLEIHATCILQPREIPTGSVFKGYRDFVVQDISIRAINTRYRIARWKSPAGKYLEGKLPSSVNGHFGARLKSYILYQYFHSHVTQPLLLEQLLEWGIEISAGEINRVIVEGKESFDREKEEILRTALEISSYIQADDTGARHDGKNGYCTHIGNDLFTYFASTDSKSRINFLKLLTRGKIDWRLDEQSLAYMEAQKIPSYWLWIFKRDMKAFASEEEWREYLEKIGCQNKWAIHVATEAILVRNLLRREGFNPNLVILSDDAGQFRLFLHALCWIHAERALQKLFPQSPAQEAALEESRNKLWLFYKELKAYRENPIPEKKEELKARFDEIFSANETPFPALNAALERIYENKAQLLLVLDRPEIPLHNNGSERDIREYVKRRKVSGSTRSLAGRRSRDTFTSLKKTCRKLQVSFWEYLFDRLSGTKAILPLPTLIRTRACAPT